MRWGVPAQARLGASGRAATRAGDPRAGTKDTQRVAETIRVIVVNGDEDAAPELRAHLLSVEGVKIVAEIDDPALLGQALNQFPAEVLLVHLDPNPPAMMDAVAPLIEQRKDRLAAIGMTEDRDAELVMRAMRVGMREFLWKPFPPEQLNEILQRIGGETAGSGARLGQLIPIVGTCGGVGATTIATNLAVELAQVDGWQGITSKPRVAVVDLDYRFGQVAMFLDAQPTYTIAELCDTVDSIETEMIERVMVKHPSGVHVLAHPQDMQAAERISAAHTASVLSALQAHYDFVVVDGPVRFDPTAKAVFDMTDLYLLVLQLLVPSVRNTDRMVHELARNGFNLDRMRLVCNRFGRDAGFLEAADVETTLNRKIEWTLPDDWKAASTAINMGSSLMDYAPKSKLRQAYQKLALAIAQKQPSISGAARESAVGEGVARKGIFSFLAGAKA